MILRYLAESVIGKGWSWRVYVLRIVCLVRPACMVQNLSILNFICQVSSHWAIELRSVCKTGGIVLGFGAAVEDAIISKETDCTTDSFVGEVVDVYQK